MSNTPERIYEDVSYYGGDQETHELITKTISRLPEEIIEFALSSCVFMSVGRSDYGLVMPPDTKAEKPDPKIGVDDRFFYWAHDRWLIFLADHLPDDDALGIIAHEIAHAYLGHDRLNYKLTMEVEREAANLAKAWGFTGIGTDEQWAMDT